MAAKKPSTYPELPRVDDNIVTAISFCEKQRDITGRIKSKNRNLPGIPGPGCCTLPVYSGEKEEEQKTKNKTRGNVSDLPRKSL